MMDYGKEFRNYATKHLGLNGLTTDDVMKYQIEQVERSGLTPYIVEEREMRVSQMDVFSRLMMDNIIWVSGEVNTQMADIVQAQLLFLDSVRTKDITLHLSSPGGSVLAGLGIVDVMNYIKSDVASINLGLAASMGSILLSSSAKGKRYSLKFSKVMIHQVSSSTGGTVMDQRISLFEAEKYNYILFKILAENCGKTFDEVLEVAHRDKWFNSQEALDFGLIDEIIVGSDTKSITDYMSGFDDYYNKVVLRK